MLLCKLKPQLTTYLFCNNTFLYEIKNHFYTYLTYIFSYKLIFSVLICFLFIFYANSVKAQVIAAFTTDSTNGCVPFTVHCTSTPTNSVVNWYWLSSDGQTSTDPNASFTYAKPGKYRIQLKVSDYVSADSSIKDILANGIPTSFTYQYNNICTFPVPVTFDVYDTIVSGNYHWDFGDNTVSIESDPNHVYQASGSYEVHLVTFSKEGCIDSMVKTIETGQVNVNFDAPATVCSNTQIIFNSTSTSIPKSAVWMINGASVSTSITSLSYIFPNAGTYTVELVEDFGGCSFSKEKQIVVLKRPTAAFSETGSLQSCTYPVTVKFQNTSQNTDTYTWNFGDSTSLSNNVSPAHKYLKNGQFTPVLIAENNNGCSDTLTKPNLVFLGPPIIHAFKGLPASKCLPYTIQPSAVYESPEPITSYDWNFGNGTHSLDALPTYQYTTKGYYDVSLTLTTVSGCVDTFTVKRAVSVGDSVDVNFTVDKNIACGSDSFHFSSTTSAPVTSYVWYFGDGGYSGGQNTSHQYLSIGNKTITLFVNNNGCTIRLDKKDFVNVKPPIAGIKVSYDCKNQLHVTFADSSQQALTWNWNFGDNSTSIDPNPPLHSYTSSGIYTVTLSTTNAECTSTDTLVVSVLNTKPIFTFDQPQDGYLCRKAGIWMSATNPEYIADYYWDFGDGRSAFSDTLIYNYYYTTGTYYPSLVAKYKNGCFDTIYSPKPVVVTGPTASFTSIAPANCVNDEVVFMDNSKSDGIHPIVSWQWNYGDNQTETLTAPPFRHLYTKDGSYAAKLIVTDNNNNCTDTAYYTVKINSLPNVSAGADTFACEGSSVQLTASGGVSYVWNTDATLSCTSCITPDVSTNQDATYIVTGTDANNCKNSDTVQVEVVHPFIMSLEKQSVEICQTKNVLLQASGADLYSWSPSAGLSNASVANPYASPDQTTDYIVTGTDAHLCFTQTGAVTVNVYPNPQFDITDSLIVAEKGDVKLLATTGNPSIVSWNWSPAIGLSCADCPQPTLTANNTITYTAIATTDHGCSDTDIIKVHVLCNQNKIYIPTGFTPNQDGKNDWFYVMSNIDNPIRSFTVYARNGDRVFQKTNIVSNNPSQGWNGMKDGVMLSNGTYVYRIEIVCNDEVVPFTGTITLMR